MTQAQVRSAVGRALQNIANAGNALQRYAQGHPTGAVIRLTLLYRRLGGLYAGFAQDTPRSSHAFNGQISVLQRTSGDVKKVARAAGIASCGPR